MTMFQPGFQNELIDLLAPRSEGAIPDPSPVLPHSPDSPEIQRVALLPDEMADPPEFVASQFEPGTPALMFLLSLVENRELALPDFQRSFVWEPNGTRELIVSIIRGFPAGNLLFLRGGSEVFLPRAVEEAPELNGHRPAVLVLDGQQRLSSLYQAFYGVGNHRFFVDVAALMLGSDIESVVKVFSKAKAKQWTSVTRQAQSLMFPLAHVREFADWRDEVIEERDDLDQRSAEVLRSYLNRVESAVIEPIRRYQFPTTTLSEATPTEAVCTIFETLNRTGIKLSVFEFICGSRFRPG